MQERRGGGGCMGEHTHTLINHTSKGEAGNPRAHTKGKRFNATHAHCIGSAVSLIEIEQTEIVGS